jgi:hypothetical protein
LRLHCRLGLAPERYLAADGDLAAARDRGKTFVQAVIGQPADQDKVMIEPETLVDQAGQVIGPPTSAAQADPVIDRRFQGVEISFRTAQLKFAIANNGSKDRIGNRTSAALFSIIGAIIEEDTAIGTATNGGFTIICKRFITPTSTTGSRPNGRP